MRRQLKRMSRRKRWTACLLAGVMLLLQGCSAGEGSAVQQAEEPPAGAAASGENQDQAMGRYLEQEITLPEELYAGTHPGAFLQMLDGGELALTGEVGGLRYVSEDRGENWTMKDTPWYGQCIDAYISMIAQAPDGGVAVIYDPYEEEEEPSEEEGTWETVYTPQYLYADADGNAKELKWQDQENYIHQFWFGKDSRLYAYTMDSKVYEMDTEGKDPTLLFETEGLSDYVCFTENYMVVFGSKGVSLYNLESKMPEEERVLQDFVINSVGNSIGSNSDAYSIVAAEGEQPDVLYLAYAGGLYRHVIGGAAMEQLMDGSISSLGDPMMSLNGFAVLPDNEFAILYNDTKLYRYVYDPDIPSVPEEQISIYSLQESYAIRQAVSLFQKKNPEVYVRYEIGLTGDGSMTREDAVKNLNTKLMSGSGPDLLVLDGLPAASYQEKGVLADLSGIAYDMNGETSLFKNLVDACREEGKLWYIPVRFRIPLLVGDQKSVAGITDLASLADAVEALRREYPQGGIIGLKTEEEVLRTLQITSSGAWVDPETGMINEGKVADFLMQARRIYQAEIAGYDEQELEDYRENYEEHWSSDVTGEGMYYAVASASAVDVAMETQKLGAGITHHMNGGFNMISTLADQEENFDYALWQGQVPNGYVPVDRVGICSGSEENERTLEFFRFLYGEELQDLDMPTGFPVNESSFEKLKENPNEYGGGGGIIISGEDGDLFSLDIQWVTEQNFERLKEIVKSTVTICTGDQAIEQAVQEIGVNALNGESGVEDVAAEIVKKAAIYLAE